MAEYLIYFNQQWVGDHSEEWFRSRGPLARAVVEELKEAGAYVFAGGLEEDGPVFSADATSGEVVLRLLRLDSSQLRGNGELTIVPPHGRLDLGTQLRVGLRRGWF